MSIFEKYGIREIMDCTLYGITYDKYDNEVYIPVIYFDTLKISSVEQTAEQASAKGGLGNAEHVIWDYGKEITITLQDALYTMAGQNLLWGGLYGLSNMKIKGVFDPYIYDKDEYGNYVYLKKKVQTIEPDDMTDWVKFICPCDNIVKYLTYEAAAGRYKYSGFSRETQTISNSKYIDNMGRYTGVELQRDRTAIKTPNQDSIYIYTYDFFMNKIHKIPEDSEVIVKNFVDFQFNNYKINEKYVFGNEVDQPQHSVLEYQWKNCEMQLTSVNDLAWVDNINFCFHSFYDNNNKRIIFGNMEDTYCSYLDFYTTITKKIKGSDSVEKFLTFKIFLGTFYIVEDYNMINLSEEYAIYPLNTNISNVYHMDRFNQYIASNDFAIDVDKNIKSFNYSQMQEYEQANLSVYYNPMTMRPYEANDHYFTRQNGELVTGNLHIIKKGERYLKFTRQLAPDYTSLGQRINVNANKFPGTFKLVGETFARDSFGDDYNYQIEIPLCKLSSETNLELSADGEASVVDMNLKAMRDYKGNLINITKYKTKRSYFDGKCSNSTEIVPFDIKEYIKSYIEVKNVITILSPVENETYCVAADCRIATTSYQNDGYSYTYLRLPESGEFDDLLGTYVDDFDYDTFISNHREILLVVEATEEGEIQRVLTDDDLSLTIETIEGAVIS